MANNFIKILFFHTRERFLHSSATLSSASPLAPSSSSTAQFLVNSCGIPLESAVSVSKMIQLDENDHETAKSVVELFKSHNFSASQVAELLLKRPQLLHCNIQRYLQPKLEYFVNKGFVGEFLPMLIMSNPKILTRSLDSHIKPSVEFFSCYLSVTGRNGALIKRLSWLFTSNLTGNIQPNVDYLLKEGMSNDSLGKLITLQPRHITQNLDRTAYAVSALKNLGFEPSTTMFVHGLRVMLSLSKSTWEKKIDFMKTMGWEEHEILFAFRRSPAFFSLSEKKIKKGMDFCINTLKLEPQTVIANPTIFNFSVEKTLRPRYSVLKVLKLKKLLKGKENILSILMRSEKEFLRTCIFKHAGKVPDLLDVYLGSRKAKTTSA